MSVTFTSDSPLDPAEQRLLRDGGQWACVCSGEERREGWRHSLSCPVRRHDGSVPPRWPPHPLLVEPEPTPPAAPPRPTAPGEAAEALRLREQGASLQVIAAKLGRSYSWARNVVQRAGSSGSANPASGHGCTR